MLERERISCRETPVIDSQVEGTWESNSRGLQTMAARGYYCYSGEVERSPKASKKQARRHVNEESVYGRTLGLGVWEDESMIRARCY